VIVDLVLLDVDFTVLYPGAVFSGPGYAELGRAHGLELDPTGYEPARAAAAAELWEDRDSLDHDGAEHDLFTQRIVEGMGGRGDVALSVARAAAQAWNDAANFALYDDVAPALETLAAADVRVGLVSNTHRELEQFIDAFDLPIAFALSSRAHGRVKPCPTIFAAALALARVEPAAAVMVGDSLSADVRGAQAAGIRGVLLDREDRYADLDGVERVGSLVELPALLGVG
jgi:HAD superfamily hydrolase (TIGR01549 family)